MKEWKFGIDNNKLIELVLNDKKKATTSIYGIDTISKVGDKSIILYDDNSYACMIEIKEVVILPFNKITPELALLEGEGDLSLEYWRKTHLQYFKLVDKKFTENSLVIFEIFDVIKKYN